MSETDPRESNPNAGGAQGLEGDMGISSERTGPEGDNQPAEGVEGTGTRGSAVGKPEGTKTTERRHPDEPDVDSSDEEPASTDTEAEDDKASIDRTVGEDNPAEVPPHPFDPGKNPGHSHG